VAHIAATMADITAQNRTVSDAEITDILSASTVMIYPFDKTSLQQRVSSLVANGSGTVTVEWTAHRNYSGSDTPSAPSGYLAANESAVVADVVYDYKPSFGFFLPDTIRFKRQAFARPRLTTKVERVAN
jgi:Flp pilus assembly protein TadG